MLTGRTTAWRWAAMVSGGGGSGGVVVVVGSGRCCSSAGMVRCVWWLWWCVACVHVLLHCACAEAALGPAGSIPLAACMLIEHMPHVLYTH